MEKGKEQEVAQILAAFSKAFKRTSPQICDAKRSSPSRRQPQLLQQAQTDPTSCATQGGMAPYSEIIAGLESELENARREIAFLKSVNAALQNRGRRKTINDVKKELDDRRGIFKVWYDNRGRLWWRYLNGQSKSWKCNRKTGESLIEYVRSRF